MKTNCLTLARLTSMVGPQLIMNQVHFISNSDANLIRRPSRFRIRESIFACCNNHIEKLVQNSFARPVPNSHPHSESKNISRLLVILRPFQMPGHEWDQIECSTPRLVDHDTLNNGQVSRVTDSSHLQWVLQQQIFTRGRRAVPPLEEG